MCLLTSAWLCMPQCMWPNMYGYFEHCIFPKLLHWDASEQLPRYQSSWGQQGAHLGPVGPRWAPCCPHESCYLGGYALLDALDACVNCHIWLTEDWWHIYVSVHWVIFFGQWHVAWLAPIHCLNQCWFVVNRTLRNKPSAKCWPFYESIIAVCATDGVYFMTSRHKGNISLHQSSVTNQVSENVGSKVAIERHVMQKFMLNDSFLAGIKEAVMPVQILSQIYIFCGMFLWVQVDIIFNCISFI